MSKMSDLEIQYRNKEDGVLFKCKEAMREAIRLESDYFLDGFTEESDLIAENIVVPLGQITNYLRDRAKRSGHDSSDN